MLDQREAPIPAAQTEEIAKKPQSHIAAFNVGGLNLAPASNDETFDLDAEDPGTPDLFNEGGSGNKSADRKATEFTNEMGMAADVKLGNGGGSLSQLSVREIEERKRERSEEAFEALMEQIGELQKQEERARKWDAEMHDFGGQRISGADLRRLFEWSDKKENLDAVDNKLEAQGTDKEKVKKGRSEFEEYKRLKRLEQERDLTEEEKKRLREINQSQDFIRYSMEVQAQEKKMSSEFKVIQKEELRSEEKTDAYIKKQYSAASEYETPATKTSVKFNEAFAAAAQPKPAEELKTAPKPVSTPEKLPEVIVASAPQTTLPPQAKAQAAASGFTL